MTIRLKLTSTGWIAEFVGDTEIQQLFGTTQIPTPFTRNASAATVLARMKELNPRHTVVIIEEADY